MYIISNPLQRQGAKCTQPQLKGRSNSPRCIPRVLWAVVASNTVDQFIVSVCALRCVPIIRGVD